MWLFFRTPRYIQCHTIDVPHRQRGWQQCLGGTSYVPKQILPSLIQIGLSPWAPTVCCLQQLQTCSSFILWRRVQPNTVRRTPWCLQPPLSLTFHLADIIQVTHEIPSPLWIWPSWKKQANSPHSPLPLEHSLLINCFPCKSDPAPSCV